MLSDKKNLLKTSKGVYYGYSDAYILFCMAEIDGITGKEKEMETYENIISRDEKDFYVSYNPDLCPEETALVITINDLPKKFYILYGDHRNEYDKCKTLEDCIEYFKNNEDKKAFWSNNVDCFYLMSPSWGTEKR